MHEAASLVDVCLALLHDDQALVGIGDDGEVQLDIDLIPGGLQELAHQLPVRAAFAHPFELDR